MADDFRSAICSGKSWWNQARSTSFDIPLPCSTAMTNIARGGECFSWPTKSTASDLIETGTRSCDESVGSASGSSITFQDSTNKAQSSSDANPSLMQSTGVQLPNFGLSSASMENWTQDLLSGVKTEGGSFQDMLQEDLSSRSYVTHHEHVQIQPNRLHMDVNQNSSLELHHFNNSVDDSGDVAAISTSHPFVPASYIRSPTSLQGLLLQPETKLQQTIYGDRVMDCQLPAAAYRESSNYLLQPSWAEFSQLLKPSLPMQQLSSQLQFSNNTPFWNASAATSACSARPGSVYSPPPPQFLSQALELRPLCSNLAAKTNREGARYSCSSSSKKMSSEPAFKKPRAETPSPLPTFKVRKEKLGDRITALQQLVSPFGKTDTASVLHEAIEYIKFLHDQVGVLSTPYLKNGQPVQQASDKLNDGVIDGLKKDLRSRGLCLVPIASTYPVTSETSADFWHPTLGGTFK